MAVSSGPFDHPMESRAGALGARRKMPMPVKRHPLLWRARQRPPCKALPFVPKACAAAHPA